jgi:hypothetical protein
MISWRCVGRGGRIIEEGAGLERYSTVLALDSARALHSNRDLTTLDERLKRSELSGILTLPTTRQR